MIWNGQELNKAYQVIQAFFAVKRHSEGVKFCLAYAESVRLSITFDVAMDNLKFGISYFSDNKHQDRKRPARDRWIDAAIAKAKGEGA